MGDIEAKLGLLFYKIKIKMGKKLSKLCTAREILIGNTWFDKKSTLKYSWVGGVTFTKFV